MRSALESPNPLISDNLLGGMAARIVDMVDIQGSKFFFTFLGGL